MFERRLRIVLWTLLAATFALIARAGQIQILERSRWAGEADQLLTRRQFIETTRGRVLDSKGRELAVDEPCIDACVDYAAITQDWSTPAGAKWLHDHALAAAQRRDGQFFTLAPSSQQRIMLARESDNIKSQIAGMWHELAQKAGKSDADIQSARAAIIDRVEARRQFVMWQNYSSALAKEKDAKPPWYERWWPAANSTTPDQLLDDSIEIAEESQPQVILPAISSELYNQLATQAEDMPGLVLRPGRHRVYPFGASACHVIGRVALVGVDQITHDPHSADPLKKYWPNDLAGQGGIESMCEDSLRGSRGERVSSGGDFPVSTEPVPGKDITLTINIKLESAIEDAFAKRRTLVDGAGTFSEIRQNQPGAAIVIDIPTGNVLALVSYPGFDLNKFDQEYAKMRLDDLTQPLLDRACDAAYVPGSIVKPMMGLGALSDGDITPESTITCDGYFYPGGRRAANNFRCWTMSEHQTTHMYIPGEDPMPSNNLTVVDAIERSCNVFFETVAYRMGAARQHYWYDHFGLGRITGIGLPESPGRIAPAKVIFPSETWYAGIGQGATSATPLQMANATAAIARDGIWMRPNLLANSDTPNPQINLGFSPEALAAVHEGMFRVVNNRGGTAELNRAAADPITSRILLAGKTGTPQASRLTVPVRDAQGKILMKDGREERKLVDPADPAVATWYIGSGPNKDEYDHAWFIGYAPADHPKIAFAIFVEYGQFGGPVAGGIALDMLAACVREGYLSEQ